MTKENKKTKENKNQDKIDKLKIKVYDLAKQRTEHIAIVQQLEQQMGEINDQIGKLE